MSTFNLDIPSRGLKGTDLLQHVSDKLTKLVHRMQEQEHEHTPTTFNTELHIDGELWFFTHDSDLRWEGLSKDL